MLERVLLRALGATGVSGGLREAGSARGARLEDLVHKIGLERLRGVGAEKGRLRFVGRGRGA